VCCLAIVPLLLTVYVLFCLYLLANKMMMNPSRAGQYSSGTSGRSASQLVIVLLSVYVVHQYAAAAADDDDDGEWEDEDNDNNDADSDVVEAADIESLQVHGVAATLHPSDEVIDHQT